MRAATHNQAVRSSPVEGPANGATPVDGTALRSVMSHFPTGVTIIGSRLDGRDQGMTANSLTCVSLHPPIICVCLSHGSRTAEAVTQSGGLAITFLSMDQAELAKHFARPHHEHFHGISTGRTGAGYPYFPGGLGHIECEALELVDAGDHRVVLAIVTESHLTGGEPLVFHRSTFGTVAHVSDGPPESHARSSTGDAK